jgi:hypothetical protein
MSSFENYAIYFSDPCLLGKVRPKGKVLPFYILSVNSRQLGLQSKRPLTLPDLTKEGSCIMNIIRLEESSFCIIFLL